VGRADHLPGQAESLARGEEREVGGRVVEERREPADRPEELPRLADAQLAAARVEQFERGDHGEEGAEEEHRHVHHRLRGELVDPADRPGRAPE